MWGDFQPASQFRSAYSVFGSDRKTSTLVRFAVCEYARKCKIFLGSVSEVETTGLVGRTISPSITVPKPATLEQGWTMRKLKSLSMPCTALAFSKALNAKYRSSEFGGQAHEHIVCYGDLCRSRSGTAIWELCDVSCPIHSHVAAAHTQPRPARMANQHSQRSQNRPSRRGATGN